MARADEGGSPEPGVTCGGAAVSKNGRMSDAESMGGTERHRPPSAPRAGAMHDCGEAKRPTR